MPPTFIVSLTALLFSVIFSPICLGKSEMGEMDYFSAPDLISCTIFTASQGNRVFFGNNEDWNKPVSYYWVEPSGNGKYGVVYFGFGNFWPQGGLNEKGLAFDVNALPRTPLNPHPEKPRIDRPLYSFLRTCATVDELIETVKSYGWESRWKSQVHVADRTGNAVVISAGADGEIAFTRKPEGDGYLLSTNFNLANPSNGTYPCWRYDKAKTLLEKIGSEKDLNVEAFRDILNAVHQEGASVNTLYSNVYDLTNGLIYLYHWHQFEEAAVINVADEIRKKRQPTPVTTLFSPKTIRQAEQEYSRYLRPVMIMKAVVWGWLLLVVGAFLVLLGLMEKGPRTPLAIKLSWLLVILPFSLLGLWIYLISIHRPLSKTDHHAELPPWKQALAESVFAVASYTIGMAIGIGSFYLYLPFNASGIGSIILRVYLLPAFIGIFLVQLPVWSAMTHTPYLTVLRQRYLQFFTTLNGSFAGLMLVSGILAGLAEKHFAMHGPAHPLFWGVITLGAFAGVITLYPFTLWMACRKYLYWPIRLETSGKTDNKTKWNRMALSNAWGAALLSFLLMLGAALLLLL